MRQSISRQSPYQLPHVLSRLGFQKETRKLRFTLQIYYLQYIYIFVKHNIHISSADSYDDNHFAFPPKSYIKHYYYYY